MPCKAIVVWHGARIEALVPPRPPCSQPNAKSLSGALWLWHREAKAAQAIGTLPPVVGGFRHSCTDSMSSSRSRFRHEWHPIYFWHCDLALHSVTAASICPYPHPAKESFAPGPSIMRGIRPPSCSSEGYKKHFCPLLLPLPCLPPAPTRLPALSRRIKARRLAGRLGRLLFHPCTRAKGRRKGAGESVNKMRAGKSPTTPKQAGAFADQGSPWESGGSRKADLGDFGPSKSDRGRADSCPFPRTRVHREASLRHQSRVSSRLV